MIAMLARPTSTNSEIVFSPNNTVATIRAQLLPLLFAQAIHSHSSTPMIPITTRKTSVTLPSVGIWAAVRTDLPWLRRVALALIAALVIVDLILLLKAAETITPMSAM